MGQDLESIDTIPYSVYCKVWFKNRVAGLALEEPRVFYESGDFYVEKRSRFC
jgi:hypothetical protein